MSFVHVVIEKEAPGSEDRRAFENDVVARHYAAEKPSRTLILDVPLELNRRTRVQG